MNNAPMPSAFAWFRLLTLGLITCFEVLVGSEQVRIYIDDSVELIASRETSRSEIFIARLSSSQPSGRMLRSATQLDASGVKLDS